MSLAKAIILGRVGSDLLVKQLPSSGKSVCNFNIAVNHKTNGNEETSWFRVVAFDKLAETCGRYLKKGQQVLVDGNIKIRSYQDKNGVKKDSVEITASSIQFLGNSSPGPNKEELAGNKIEDNSKFGGTDYNTMGSFDFNAHDIPF
jgi:single-strand DNA-binding protein